MKKVLALSAALLFTTATHAQDMDEIKERVMKDVKSSIMVSGIIDAVKAQNSEHAGLSESDVMALDKKWRAETQSADKPMITEVLESSVSGMLRDLKVASNGYYSEIFVMDNKGLNVAQSDVTSDYWQGDEAKFQKTYEMGPDAVFIDEVEYDESAESFATQVSVTIKDETGAAIGAVTLGVNIE